MSIPTSNDVFQWRIGLDLTYQHVDAGKEQLLDLPAGSLVGAHFTRCMHPDDAAMLRRALVPAKSTGACWAALCAMSAPRVRTRSPV